MDTILKIRLNYFLLIILAFTLSNCMSNDYNLKNGINTDVSLGGDSLSFPLGKSSPILLSSMIKDTTGQLKTLANDTYSLQLKDSSQMNVSAVNPVTFSIVPIVIPVINSVFSGIGTPPSSIKREILTDYSSQFILLNKKNQLNRLIPVNKNAGKVKAALNTLNYNLPNQYFDIAVNRFVSTSVNRINDFTLKTASQLVFKIAINNLNPAIDSLYFNNYTIQLPYFLKFTDPAINSSNQLVLNEGFLVKNGYTKTLTFNTCDFNSEGGIALTNGLLNLISTDSLHGSAYIRSTNLTPDEIGVFQVQPSIVVGDMQVSLMNGDIKPTTNPITKIITLNLPDIIKQTGSILDIQNPVITLKVGNSMGFLVNSTLQMIPKRNGVVIPDGTVSTQFTIQPADILGQSSWSNFWISKDNVGISTGYTPIITPDLPNLLKIAPDEIEINVIPVISGNNQHIDLYSPKNQVNIIYSVNVPLDFGKDFKIQYLDTISNLKKNLEQIIKLSKQVEFTAIIDNQIPLDLNFEIVPLDISKQIISGISVSTPQTINSCNVNGTSQRSTLNLTIKETASGALNQLDALQIKVSATKNSAIAIANIPLKSTQSMTVQLSVKVPKGITITQN